MKNIFLIILVIGLLGCKGETEIPEDVLPKDKMVRLLIDIHLLEERIDYISSLPLDSARRLYRAYEYEIFKKHNVDTATYQKIYKFYSYEMNHMKDIYEVVVDSLNVRLQKKPKKKKVDKEGEPSKSADARNRPVIKNEGEENE